MGLPEGVTRGGDLSSDLRPQPEAAAYGFSSRM